MQNFLRKAIAHLSICVRTKPMPVGRFAYMLCANGILSAILYMHCLGISVYIGGCRKCVCCMNVFVCVCVCVLVLC